MLKKIWRNKVTLTLVFLLVALLACVRMFERQLFYDPFLEFFKSEFQNAKLPAYNTAGLFVGLLFRYFLNGALSIAVIYVVFKDSQLTKVVSILYVIFFVLLSGTFFSILEFYENPDYMLLFYVRRFLIQPIFLVLFLPAFYYQKKNSGR